MASTVDRKASLATGKSEGAACNFQHLFKMQMIKRERKSAHLHTDIREGKAAQACKVKERSNKIINLLLDCPQNPPSLRQSLDSSRNPPTPRGKQDTRTM